MPLIGTLAKDRRDYFWKYLAVGTFLGAVRG